MMEARNGVNVIANNQEIIREMNRIQKSAPVNSPDASGDKPIGANAVTAMTVAPNKGQIV